MTQISFEEKIKKSKEILDKLMDPEITLENSVKFYKEGIKELQEAQKLLEEAKIAFEEYHDKSKIAWYSHAMYSLTKGEASIRGIYTWFCHL